MNDDLSTQIEDLLKQTTGTEEIKTAKTGAPVRAPVFAVLGIGLA